MTTPVIGLRVRRVDMPSPDLLSITLGGAAGRAIVVYRFSGTPRGAGLVDERPKGSPADAFTRRLRKLFEGAALRAMAAGPSGRLSLRFERGDGARTLLLEVGERGGVLLVVDDGAKLVAALHGRTDGLRIGEAVPGERLAATEEVDEVSLWARGPSVVAGAFGESLRAKKRTLRRALRRTQKRLARRLEKIEADGARALETGGLRTRAAAITSHLHLYEAGASHLIVVDYAVDPPKPERVEIDPALGAKGEAEALFRRARRLERGADKSEERARITRAELAQIAVFAERLDGVADEAAVDELADQAARAGVRGAREIGPPAQKTARNRAETRRPYRRFNGHDGRAILVGRGARDNDELTLRYAKPKDLWLHARGYRGAHVIVPLDKGEECATELLLDAATLAVHFSAAAGEDRAPVQHTARRYVRKPRGAAPGAVLVDRESVLILRHEPARLSRLLSSEERG